MILLWSGRLGKWNKCSALRSVVFSGEVNTQELSASDPAMSNGIVSEAEDKSNGGIPLASELPRFGGDGVGNCILIFL